MMAFINQRSFATIVSQTTSMSTSSTGNKLSSLFLVDPSKPTFINPRTTTLNSNLKSEDINTHFCKYVRTTCRAGHMSIEQAKSLFDHMLNLNPTPHIAAFNSVLVAMVKIKQFHHAIYSYRRLNISGLNPNFLSLNVVLNCYCSLKWSSAGFSVLGLIMKKGFEANVMTMSFLVKGLCLEDKIGEAVGLFRKMLQLGCEPDVVTIGISS